MPNQPVRAALQEFVTSRDWDQFHTPENLIKSISIEAAELLECVQWDNELDDQAVRDELADVLTYCHLLAARLGLDHWKRNVEDKLETLNDIHRFAVEQTGMAQGNLLELVIVLILVIEFGMLFS